jgi:hypothetical protein
MQKDLDIEIRRIDGSEKLQLVIVAVRKDDLIFKCESYGVIHIEKDSKWSPDNIEDTLIKHFGVMDWSIIKMIKVYGGK